MNVFHEITTQQILENGRNGSWIGAQQFIPAPGNWCNHGFMTENPAKVCWFPIVHKQDKIDTICVGKIRVGSGAAANSFCRGHESCNMLLSVFIYNDMTGHPQSTAKVPSLINITQIKNDWHSSQTSCQESERKLNCLNHATLSCALCFFAKENKCPIKIQSITGGAALYHHLRVKRQGEEVVAANKSCMMPLSLSLFCNLRAKENSPVTACGLYLHLAEDITCTFMKLNSSYLTAQTR